MTIHWIAHNAVDRGTYTEVVVDCYDAPFDEAIYAGKKIQAGTSERDTTPVAERMPYSIVLRQGDDLAEKIEQCVDMFCAPQQTEGDDVV